MEAKAYYSLHGLEADDACNAAAQSVRAHLFHIFAKASDNEEMQFNTGSDYRARKANFRTALDDVKSQIHQSQLISEVLRRCLAIEEAALECLLAKKNEIVLSVDTIDHERPYPIQLPEELILYILSLVDKSEEGQGNTTLQKLLRLPRLSGTWKSSLRSLMTYSVRETFGMYSNMHRDPGGRDLKMYEEMKCSAPAKLDVSFFSCNIDSVRTALEFCDRWSAVHYRSSQSGSAAVDALEASKGALPNVRHLSVELIEYRERAGGYLLPESSWRLYGDECRQIHSNIRSARIFLPFLGGVSALLQNVEELELLLPANYTDWESANAVLASLPSLVHLIISPCKVYHKRNVDLFSDEDLMTIASTGPVHLPNLISLQINFDSRIAAAIITFVCSPSLRRLHLNTNEIENARGRSEVAPPTSLLKVANEAYPCLKEISVQKSDDHFLRALAEPDERGSRLFPNLTSLDLPTPSPLHISSLLNVVRTRLSDPQASPLHLLRITNPTPSGKDCRLEMTSLSLLVPNLIVRRNEANQAASAANQVQSYCRVQ